MQKALWLAVEILNQIRGYAHYDAFMASYEKYNEIVPVVAKEKFAPTAKAWLKKYGEEKLIYVMGSGPNFGVTPILMPSLPVAGDAVDPFFCHSFRRVFPWPV